MWNFLAESFTHIERYVKRSQIAVVDPDKSRLERQRSGKFVFIVNLDKNVQAKIMRRAGQAARLSAGDAGHDDQNAIGAIRAGLVHLVGVEQKVLAETWQMRCLPCRREVAEAALKRGPVGEHRETG